MSRPPEPLSWLVLERYHLGELDLAERLAVEARLQASAADREILARIGEDAASPQRPLRREARRRRLWAPWPLAGLAAAAVAGVWLSLGPPPDAGGDRLKGDPTAFVLLRERGGEVTEDPSQFAPRDRFQVDLSCGALAPVFWDVVAVQGERAFFPLAPTGPVACGNRVRLPGAFRLDGGEPIQLCLVLRGAPWERRLETSEGQPQPPPDASCRVLWPGGQP